MPFIGRVVFEFRPDLLIEFLQSLVGQYNRSLESTAGCLPIAGQVQSVTVPHRIHVSRVGVRESDSNVLAIAW